MKKHTAAVVSTALIFAAAACSNAGTPLPDAARDIPPPATATHSPPPTESPPPLSPTPTTSSAPVSESRAVSLPITVPEPGIPTVVDHITLGIPAGNGHRPYQIAVDGQRRRAYTLNYGEAEGQGGNTISVLDLETEEVTALIHLDNMETEDSLLPDPLDLQVDPYRPRLYALWGDRYAEVPDSALTIIDADTLSIVDTVPGVEALAVGPDRLYLANDSRLWAVDPESLTELEGRDLGPLKYNEPLLVNPQANRLYLARGRPWSLETFEADTLRPVNSYALNADLGRAVVDVRGERLFVLENDGQQLVLRAMSADGSPLTEPAPVPVTDNVYADFPLAFDGQTLFLADGEYEDYRIDAFSLPNLKHTDSLPVLSRPNDLTVDPMSGLVYAAYSSYSSYVLVIDPASGPVKPIYIARTVTDALVDADMGRLYALDDGGILHVLSTADYRELTQVATGFSVLGGKSGGYGELSLDPGRNRLYIGGDPIRIVDTDSLQVMVELDGRGQITPDPKSDRLYLTPPCHCREEVCNTLILNADTLKGTQALFPSEEDPMVAPCVVATRLDPENQLLYAMIYNGTPGSNSGDYYTIFDVSGEPEELYTAYGISYGYVALDPVRGRAFAPRYRINRAFIHRFEVQTDKTVQSLELVGAHGQLAYDPEHDRLYAVQEDALVVFDGDLSLLLDTSLPGDLDLLSFDPQGQRLYLGAGDGDIMVVATGGGELETPPPSPPTTDQPQVQQALSAPDGSLFRVYDYRLYRSEDDGQSWDPLGRGLPGRMVGPLALSPEYEKDQTLLVGLWDFGRGGGLFRSSDGGDTWTPITRGLTDLEIDEIVFSPTYARDRTLFLTTFDHGLFRSNDGGDTWTGLAEGYAADAYDREVTNLALSPAFADDNLILISKRHLLRSTDGGQSWVDTQVPGGLIAFSPNFEEDELILSSGNWRSADGGKTWQPSAVGREPGIARELFFSPTFAVDQSVYLLLEPDDSVSLRLQRSVDAGLTWDSLMGGLPAEFEISSVILLSNGELHLTARDGQELTVQGEAMEWGRPPVDIAQFEPQDLAVASDGTIFVANSDAGVFKSADGGRSWAETRFPARSRRILQPARLAVTEDGALFGAAGTVLARSNDGGESWTYLDRLPTGFEIASLGVSPNFAQDGVVVVGGTYSNQQIQRSTDGGETWETVFEGADLDLKYASDLAAFVFSPNFADDGTLYAWLRDGGPLRSTDSGRSWKLMVELGYYGQSLAVSPNGNRLYLGALDGRVMVSEDGGRNWLDLSEEVPDDRIWSSALVFDEDGNLFLGTDRGVYRSPDGGQSWTWASAGLPLRPGEEIPYGINALAFHQGQLYAAPVEGGLFVSDDLGETWRSTLTGEPASSIEMPFSFVPEAQTPEAQAPGTPGPEESASPTPTPPLPVTAADCPAAPDYFEDLWSERLSQLGCPVASYTAPMVEQSFEGGWMFWRGDTRHIYALPLAHPYARFDDAWDESQPIYSCPDLFPSQTPPTPHRGFGLVWCNQPLVRKLLGNATSSEGLFEATLQEFETGLIFKMDSDVTYILESGMYGWEQVE